MGFISNYVKHKVKVWVLLSCAVAVIALMFFSYKSGINKAQYTMALSKPQISSAVIEQRLSEIRELATVEYNYTTMGYFENSSNFYGVKLPFTTKKFVVSYDGMIKAGVELNYTDIEVKENEIVVTLPKSKILSHQVFENSLQVYDEKNGLFNPLTIEDFNGFYMSQKESMELKAIEKGLLEKADTKAKVAVEEILESIADVNNYTIKVITN